MKEPQNDNDNKSLAEKYRPLLVLYPEIEDGSRRQDHHHADYGPGKPPLDQDYHPRDIRLVLDNACLPGQKEKPSRDALLDAMSANIIDYVDLIDERGPKEVDKFWRVYADMYDKDSNPEYQRKAYARVVRGSRWFEDYISIQYWLAYFFDDWANVHEMDWEVISVIVKKTGSMQEPVTCVFSAHIGAFRKPWSDVHKADDAGNKNTQGSHPIAYIANGSHAVYFSDYPPDINVASPYLRPVLRRVIRITGIGKGFTDYIPSFEDGIRRFPEVEVIPEPDKFGHWSGDWRWLNFRGRWGSPVQFSGIERLVAGIPVVRKIPMLFQRPLREAGIQGPPARIDASWHDPFTWVNLECTDALQTSNWIKRIDGASANEL